MRTEVISARLPLHEAALVRRHAAAIGLTKSEHAANLILRGLTAEARGVLPVTIERLETVVETLIKLSNAPQSHNGSGDLQPIHGLHPELRAFMIEVLMVQRYLIKNDLRFHGEIGRKLQKVVGDVRVEGL